MTVAVELESDLAARLRENAERRGQSTAEYLRELAEQAVSPPPPRLSADEWTALLETVPPTAASAPAIPSDALRRERLYEDNA